MRRWVIVWGFYKVIRVVVVFYFYDLVRVKDFAFIY